MDELKYLSGKVAKGALSRRDFMGRASALGVTAGLAGTLLADAAKAAGPQKGGIIRAGMQGGESTNSLDPATWASNVPSMWGGTVNDTLVEVSPTGTARAAA